MAYCSKCGAEVQGSFCSNCGNPVNTLSVQHNYNNEDRKIHVVGDFTYTDDDLKHYENLLNSEISEAEINLKKSQRRQYIGLGLGAVALIHWFATTGFWNAIITILIGFYAFLGLLGNEVGKNHYSSKINKLKQHNPYTYMMEKIAEVKDKEKRMQNIATGIKAANVGLKIYNIFRNF